MHGVCVWVFSRMGGKVCVHRIYVCSKIKLPHWFVGVFLMYRIFPRVSSFVPYSLRHIGRNVASMQRFSGGVLPLHGLLPMIVPIILSFPLCRAIPAIFCVWNYSAASLLRTFGNVFSPSTEWVSLLRVAFCGSLSLLFPRRIFPNYSALLLSPVFLFPLNPNVHFNSFFPGYFCFG